MSKHFSLLFVITFLSTLLGSQDLSQLDYLPESVREAVLLKMEESNSFDTFEDDKSLRDSRDDEDDEDDEEEESDLDMFDLTKNLFDQYGSRVPQPFGYDLFTKKGRKIPLQLQSAPSSYVLGPGDQIQVSFSGSTRSSRKITIDREGNIFISEIGSINLAGLTYARAQKELEKIVDASLIGSEISISLVKVRPIQIYVVGHVNKPGAYNMNGLSSITSALYDSHGPSDQGSLRNISIKRANEVIASLDVYELFLRGNSQSNTNIQSGDVLLVNPKGKQVKIFGEVLRPAIYEMKNEETFEDLLFFASGVRPQANIEKITLTRLSSGEENYIKDYSLEELKDMELEAGDSLYVHRLQTTSLDANKDKIYSITLEGSFKNPGKYYLKPEETFKELLERAGGYKEDAYIEAGIFLRKSVAKREKDGFNRAADDLERGIARAIQTGQFAETSSPDLILTLIGNIVEKLRTTMPLGRVTTEFEISKIEGDLDFVLRNEDRIIMPKQSSTVSVAGEVLSPSSFTYSSSLSYKDYIELAGGAREGANFKEIFFILPNGQAKRPNNSWFKSQKLYPGTIIIVPQDTSELSTLALWKAVLPIFSNLVQTLAAIDALSD